MGTVKSYDRRTASLGLHRTARSPRDAPDESLARATLDPLLDDRGDAHGRRLAVVHAGRGAVGSRWGTKIRGRGRGGQRGAGRSRRLQDPEASEPPAAAMPV